MNEGWMMMMVMVTAAGRTDHTRFITFIVLPKCITLFPRIFHKIMFKVAKAAKNI